MLAAEIRQRFFDFFRKHQHQIVPSAPIVNKDDPSLMFINAGMNQFKDIFTGDKPVEHPRVADTQKCLRVSGKHNDLEEVGHDTYHHTMFEMLGNWSFGDYFKEKTLELAWTFLTRECNISPELLYVTVFEGDATQDMPRDDETALLWEKYVPKERILFCGAKDNFWEMGEVGPCGPCTEVHIDLRSAEEKARIPGAQLVNADHPEVIEIWNLVFIQFNRKANGNLDDLKMKSVDTGMGLERLAMVLQEKKSTYDTDLFQQLIAAVEQGSGISYQQGGLQSVAHRVVVDHIRAITFTIADGQLPSNTGAGYVVRRLIRRAARYAYQYLNLRAPFQFTLLQVLRRQFAEVFPEIEEQAEFIAQVIEQEEKSFLQTLERGTKLFEEYLQKNSDKSEKLLDGFFAFELYDTYGFPLDLTRVMASEKGWRVDEEGFRAHMAQQRARSKSDAAAETGDWVELAPARMSEFIGYDKLSADVELVKYRSLKKKKATVYQLVLNRTPFYPESGGQVGDAGWLIRGEEKIRIQDTIKENELIIHIAEKLPENPGGEWLARVDEERRRKLTANHSATHLLHEALRRVLGEHVEQRGSLVAPDYLRFDFSHFQGLSQRELEQVEQMVNEAIEAAIPLEEFREVPIAEAQGMGARALFGEKYGDTVRVIRFSEDYSTELCGGTHVMNTVNIRLFVITSEASIASGIRRIEALTGDAALQYLKAQQATVQQLQNTLKQPKQLVQAVENLQKTNKKLEKELEKMKTAQAAEQAKALANAFEQVGSVQFLGEIVEAPDADTLRKMAMQLMKSATGAAVVVLGANVNGKALLNVALSEPAIKQADISAKELIKAGTKHIKGGGGGQPAFASAGGKNPQGMAAALGDIKAALQR